MELLALELERFGRVTRASITFAPGLNVLHGPNDLGKSSIASAIRFALLLPSSSREAEAWVPWRGGGDPTVTLTFRAAAEGSFRVRKVFGTDSAILERSADGASWASVARKREVEAHLRRLLRWGIPEPGGSGGPRGLPVSFLASALLAEQDAVGDLLRRSFADDPATSGQERVRDALQAIAQDPLFKAVLARAQQRVDEAFTATGQPRRGARDPFPRMRDEVRKRQQESELATKSAQESAAHLETLARLRSSAANADGTFQEAALHHRQLADQHERHRALTEARRARIEGEKTLTGQVEAEANLKAVAAELTHLVPWLPGLREAAERARQERDGAASRLELERARQREALFGEEAAILRERDSLRQRRTATEAALAARAAQALAQQGEALAVALASLDVQISLLRAVEPWLQLQQLRTARERAVSNQQKAATLLAEAASLRAQAAGEWPTPVSSSLPDGQRMQQLRRLHQDLLVAESKLSVGLSVDVQGSGSITAELDGHSGELQPLPLSVQAEAAIRLRLADGTDVRVRGGRAEQRQAAERHRREWRQATEALFTAHGIGDLVGLEEAVRIDAERKTRAESLQRDAQAFDGQRSALGDPIAEQGALDAQVDELEQALADVDLDLVGKTAATHGAGWRKLLVHQQAVRDAKTKDLAGLRERQAVMRQQALASATEIGDPDAEVTAVAAAERLLRDREQALVRERQRLQAPAVADQALETAATAAAKALQEADDRLGRLQRSEGEWRALVQERSKAAAAINITSLRAAEEAVLATAADGEPVELSAVANAARQEEEARAGLEAVRSELHKAEGALAMIGGAAAEERARELEASLQRICEQQAQMEDDYEAWRLLADALREAERTQATHLGSLLAPDLDARFQALVGTRYAGVAVGPGLGFEGVECAGERRDVERLSVGTREQLATVFRLCLAERLGSALLLDDQLVQSDPGRLRWFRQALRETAAKGVQIIVLTCRPEDYVDADAMPKPHMVDLGRVVGTE